MNPGKLEFLPCEWVWAGGQHRNMGQLGIMVLIVGAVVMRVGSEDQT